ncbi:MAG: hypothetical protein A3J55_01270 [Candidatus Ryanbacteria bacterium RIFCSPHIGHO2_02_FULL_45_17b]|uniref:Uncharacterized protein n=1 Tax=Candidatus Ryanbacteria bacterium RIFCSPHIGHO2_01_FULL_45_22 TaxID=1802114 RepID=A0A1G2G221_9BACT|nr:MAG: hypothetical protein A2719_03740 [Candidatus Ryanbacteria bacterium RIFCSPHIGHO2_01_FULL_45_22]OGZ47164.1 MAG: hypothetical protein A3J55_01270 [Candidatus Ryanbacteria bacterium RIFCSPHIGHO2_02_FULL_45_17b]
MFAREKLSHVVAVALLLMAVSIIAVASYFGVPRKAQHSFRISCTLEAKLCPDGSYVGRTGQNCEFEECAKPSITQDDTSDWKTYLNEEYGFEFKYPSSWSISLSKWPIHLIEGGDDIIVISTIDLTLAGITYCEAYPQDMRCELAGAWMIDWGDSTTVTAQMNYADGMTAMLTTLYKTSTKNKKDFKQFLSTFKFID